MKKIAGLIVSLLAITSLTGCEIDWGDEVDNNQQQQQTPSGEENNNQDSTNNNGDQNYNGDESNNNGQTGGDNNQGGGQQGTGGDNNNNNPTVNTISVTVADLAAGYSWENATKYLNFQLDTKLSVIVAGGTNTGKYYDSGDGTYRLYGNEGATITFQAPSGEKVTSVKLTFEGKDGGSFTEGLQSGVAKTNDSNYVTYHLGSNGQIRISAFEVKYTGEAGQDPFARSSWTPDELALIEQHAYGVSLPFYYMLGNKLAYDDTNDILYFEGAKTTLEETNHYLDLFRADTSWTVIPNSGNSGIGFEKVVTANNNQRYIRIFIGLYDTNKNLVQIEGAIGTFSMRIFDPYYYEWNASLFAYIAKDLLGSTATIPAIPNVSRYEISEYDEGSYLLESFEQTSQDFEDYLTLLSNTYDVTLDSTGFNVAVPKALDDLELWLYFSEGVIEMLINARLPHLSEFPQTEVKEYNGGIEILPPEGASYFGLYIDSFSWYDEEEDETYTYVFGVCAYAYGISSDELNDYLDDLQTAHWTVSYLGEDDDDGLPYYSAETVTDDNLYYYFVFSYDSINEVISITVTEKMDVYYSVTFPSEAIQAFFTKKNLTATFPVLTDTGIDGFYYQTTYDDYYDYDNFFCQVSGNHLTAFLAIFDADTNYTVPATPDDEYGYMIYGFNGAVEVDLDYDDEDNATYFYVYSTADYEE